MTRGVLWSDRVVSLVVGLVLLGVGALAVVWGLDLVPSLRSDSVAVEGAAGVSDAGWWPLALGLAGMLLVVGSLTWCLAHLRRASIRAVSLSGSGPEGRLRLRLDALASASAASAADRISVESASGRTGSGAESGLVDVALTARHDATLDELRGDLRRVDREVALATDGAVPVRYRVRVARPPRDAAAS